MATIVEPVAKDSASQLNIGAVFNGPVYLQLNSVEANAAQNAARREIEKFEEPAAGHHTKVLMYWYQARNSPGNSAGDKAIIESISERPIKVAFASETLKANMMFADNNPFREAYVVDVVVETIGNRPMLYRITELHETIERDGAEES